MAAANNPPTAQAPTYTAEHIPADTDAAVFLGNPHVDNLMTVVIALGTEIWSDRQRQRVTEVLLEKHGRVTREMIETYVPTEAEKSGWAAERDAMVRRVYSVLQRDTSKAAAFGAERSSGAVS